MTERFLYVDRVLIAYINHVEAEEGLDFLGWDEEVELPGLSKDENAFLTVCRDKARRLREAREPKITPC